MAKKPAKKPAAKKAAVSKRSQAEIALELESTLAKGKACYVKADGLVAELVRAGAKHGTRIVVNEKSGRTLKLVDRWRGKLKCFTSAVFARYVLEKVEL